MAWPGIRWSLEAMQAMIIQQLVTTLASIQATPTSSFFITCCALRQIETPECGNGLRRDASY